MSETNKPTKAKEDLIPLVMRAYMAAKLFNVSERHGQRMIEEAKERLGKEPHQFVSYHEFIRVYGLDEKEALPYLRVTYWHVLIMAVILFILRDDTDIAGLLLILWLMLMPRVKRITREEMATALAENDPKNPWIQSMRTPWLYPVVTALMCLSSITCFLGLNHSDAAWKYYGAIFSGVVFGVLTVLGVVGMAAISSIRRKT